LDPPGGERLGEAFEPPPAQRRQLKQPAEEPAGRLADHDAARRRKRLQSCREVRRLADHALFACRTFADQLANHDQAGGNADPCRQRFARRRLLPGKGIDNREPRPHRALGLVLVRLRPAEIGQDAIAHIFRDMAAPVADRLSAATVIGADHGAHILGIEPRRQHGRAHQIDEHYRELPPLRFAWSRRRTDPHRRRHRRASGLSQGRDRLQQLLSMAERCDAKLP
jgi:hypothetical protein